MTPSIQSLKEIKLVGRRQRMSFARNKTKELWQGFMPKRKTIENSFGSALYSVEIYDDPTFFKNFMPTREFDKWAAIRVSDFNSIPDGMESMNIPTGLYAVFPYKGKPSEVHGTYQYIHEQWIPNSKYVLDNRPHFALMGDKYKGENPESEEELWIPIKKN